VIVITAEPQEDFRRAVASLQKAAPQIRKMLSASVRAAGKPLVVELQDTVNGLSSKGYGSGGRKQRHAYYAGRTKSGRSNRNTSLRANVARGVRLKARFAGEASIQVTCDTRALPQDERRLPALMDRGTWRHPVMGDRNAWVTQTVSPVGWFTKTASAYAPKAFAEMEKAADKLLKEI
jgi:hypothetical protein